MLKQGLGTNTGCNWWVLHKLRAYPMCYRNCLALTGTLCLTEIVRNQEWFAHDSLAKKLTPLIFPASIQASSSAKNTLMSNTGKSEGKGWKLLHLSKLSFKSVDGSPTSLTPWWGLHFAWPASPLCISVTHISLINPWKARNKLALFLSS